MSSKVNSFEDKVKLPITESISRFYQPKRNRKAIRIITVALYVLCVSVAAIMLSLYYIFIYDPTVKPFVPKQVHCDKIVIPEQITIRLMNSSDISTDQYNKNIFPQYQSLKSGIGAGINRDPIKEMSLSLPMLIKRIKESLHMQEQRGLRSRLKRKHIKFGKTMRNSLDDDDEDGDVDLDAETSSGMGEKVDDKDKQNGKRNRRVNRRRSEEEDTIYEGSAFYTINDLGLESTRFN